MKTNVIFMPLLLAGNLIWGQFNTLSYQDKIALVNLSQRTKINPENTFMSYHIQGKQSKRSLKEDKPDEKPDKVKDKDKQDSENPKRDALGENTLIQEESLPVVKSLKRLEPVKVVSNPLPQRQMVYMPLQNITITSDYSWRFHPIDKKYKDHNGIDLKADNQYVYAVVNGVVSGVGYDSNSGNFIRIRHRDFETLYLHLEKVFFVTGDTIHGGAIIAVSGNTGKSTGPHLHFAVKENGKYIDPVDFLNDLIAVNNAIYDYNLNH